MRICRIGQVLDPVSILGPIIAARGWIRGLCRLESYTSLCAQRVEIVLRKGGEKAFGDQAQMPTHGTYPVLQSC